MAHTSGVILPLSKVIVPRCHIGTHGRIFTPATIKVEYLWFNLIKSFLPFGNFLSKNLEIGVLKRVRTPLKGVLKECHSIFNGGVGAGVPLNLLAVSGSGSATQKIKEC